MDSNWSKWGDDIRQTVDSSIKSGDFSKLSKDINYIIESAIDNVHQELERVGDKLNNTMNDKMKKEQQNYNTSLRMRKRSYYERTGKYTAVGILMLFLGFIGIGIFLDDFIRMIVRTIVQFDVLGLGGIIASCVWGAMLSGSIILLSLGIGKIGFVKQFKMYIKCLGDRVTCTIAELAQTVKRDKKSVQRSLKRMIKKGYFKEGHIDELEGRLIVSDEYYKTYMDAKKQYLEHQEMLRKERELEKKKEQIQRAEQEKVYASIPEEVRQIITDGAAFIQKIHESNEAIPGEEISAKIDRMEQIVRKIFQRVQEKPELSGDMKKMMSYYLPTTVKLLNVYEELDTQAIQGPNILKSKQEIEQTLDTLNIAFEKLLDDFYQEIAWDVSSDISVLNTMLAQEGLTKSDFDNK